MSVEKQKNVISKQNVACFTYDLAEDIQGKVGTEDGIFFKVENIEIICFRTGICFFTLKTIIENSNEFTDVLDFNYRFKDINSEFLNLKSFENINLEETLRKINIQMKTNFNILEYMKNIQK